MLRSGPGTLVASGQDDGDRQHLPDSVVGACGSIHPIRWWWWVTDNELRPLFPVLQNRLLK